MRGTVVRVAGGRATEILVRHWLNGTRRAPAWFVAVVVSELEKQIAQRQDILAQLPAYKPQDRGERSRKQAVLAREQMLAGIGAIGKRRKERQAALLRAEATARGEIPQTKIINQQHQ